jgi:Flp pilus assembly protein TadB
VTAAPSGGVATIPANIVVSTLEDIVALATSLVAVIVPVLLALVLVIAVVTIAWWLLNQQRARNVRA